jgi:hypothetical protein
MTSSWTVALLLFTLCSAAALAADRSGVVVVSIGKSFRSPAKKGIKPLLKNSKVFNRDRIMTSKKSYLKLLMEDDSIFALGASSSVVIKKFEVVNSVRKSAMFVHKKGQVRANFSRKKGSKKVVFKTKHVSIDVLGTEFISEVHPNHTDILLISGVVDILDRKTKQRVNLKAGQSFKSAMGSFKQKVKLAGKKAKKVSSAGVSAIKTVDMVKNVPAEVVKVYKENFEVMKLDLQSDFEVAKMNLSELKNLSVVAPESVSMPDMTGISRETQAMIDQEIEGATAEMDMEDLPDAAQMEQEMAELMATLTQDISGIEQSIQEELSEAMSEVNDTSLGVPIAGGFNWDDDEMPDFEADGADSGSEAEVDPLAELCANDPDNFLCT